MFRVLFPLTYNNKNTERLNREPSDVKNIALIVNMMTLTSAVICSLNESTCEWHKSSLRTTNFRYTIH